MECRLNDEVEIASRIAKATKAFGALLGPVFKQQGIHPMAKKAAYTALVLNILLYGCESWILSAKSRYQLRCFHRRCVRIMLDTTCWKMISSGVHHADLYKRLDLEDISTHICRRRLQWAGHVFRMPEDRLPRKFLSSWVVNPRPVGRPVKTYGQCLNQDLDVIGLRGKWGAVAEDRCAWRSKLPGRLLRGLGAKGGGCRGLGGLERD